jgi:hypothetical protein
MAFVVARPGGRFEIRESVVTPSGPRARTLAVFRTLTSEVVARAAARALRPYDAAKIRARARQLGAPAPRDPAAATARRLLAELRAGDSVPPVLSDALRRQLPALSGPVPDTIGDALLWAGADDASRGRALWDLLDLATHLPQRRRPSASAFPRISSRP